MPKQGVLPPYQTLRKWDVLQMCNWLKQCDFQEAVPIFKENNIGGEQFVYLSEFQLFQMKNVSIKTKTGLKTAQKNVKGRPAVSKKTVISDTARRSMTKVYDSINRIMATDRPPQTPSKDYKHHTPEVDDDGWGSDFDSDVDHQDEDEEEEEEDFDDEYEEPQPDPMPQLSSAPMNKRRDPPNPVRGSPANSHTRKVLPPEPQQSAEPEEYEDPHQRSDSEQEDYEQPLFTPASKLPPRLPPTPTPSHPATRRPSPPSPPGPLPPRLPPRRQEIPEETNDTEDGFGDLDEDYEEPEKAHLRVQPPADRSEIISASGKLRPSNLAKHKNYNQVDIPKPDSKPNSPWLDQSGQGPVKPSQLKGLRQGKVSSQVPKDTEKPPQLPSNKAFNKNLPSSVPKVPRTPIPVTPAAPVTTTTDRPLPGLAGRTLPRPPEKQEIEGLYSYTWYHGNLTRDSATEKLKAKSKNGMYLVRKSTRDGSPYALSLFYGGRVYNLNIRLRFDNKYALGTPKPDENSFSAVPPLIDYFQNNALVLGGDSSTQTTLVQALPK